MSAQRILVSDPTQWRNSSRWNVPRLLFWTIPRRYHEYVSHITPASLLPAFQAAGAIIEPELGESLEDSGVSVNQRRLLLKAVAASESQSFPIVEIGSYRGTTTQALANATARRVFAVDPYVGDGGHSHDMEKLLQRTGHLPNVTHLHMASGPAFETFPHEQISMVFIDAIHEYLHAKFDFDAWSSLVAEGGFVALHDSDQFAGVNRLCRHILKNQPHFQPWAHVPNMVIFQKGSAR